MSLPFTNVYDEWADVVPPFVDWNTAWDALLDIVIECKIVLDAQVQETQSSLEELEQCRRCFNQCPDKLKKVLELSKRSEKP